MMAVIIRAVEARVGIGAGAGIFSVVVFGDFAGGFGLVFFGGEFFL